MALHPLFIRGWKQLSAYQAYGTCNGVLSLGRIYGYDRLESAAALMKAETGKAGYKLLSKIGRAHV